MESLHFALIFSGTVLPGGDSSDGNEGITAAELAANLEDAVSHLMAEGMITGNSPATLESYAHKVRVSKKATSMQAIPIISTAHLDPELAESLSHDWRECAWGTVAVYPEGFFLRIFSEAESYPDCVLAIRNWMKRQGADGWIRLDRDWPVVEGLPVYDHL